MKLPRLSIRAKIVLLISVTLSASLLTDLYFSSSLIVEDKASYIYEFYSAGLNSIASTVEGQVLTVVKMARILSAIGGAEEKSYQAAAVERSGEVRLTDLYLLKAASRNQFEISRRLIGEKPELIQPLLTRLQWTPESYEKTQLQLGNPIDGKLPIAAKAKGPDGKVLAVFALMEFDPKLLEELPSEAQTFLLDSQGGVVLHRGGKDDSLSPEQAREIQASLPVEGTDSGVRSWRHGGNEEIVSYKRFAQGKLMLLSTISKQNAFSAANLLIRRSITVALGVLLIAMGLALIWARSLIGRLRQIWFATQKVSEGDFLVRVAESSGSGDELSDLASAFNTMAKKIESMIAAIVEKMRMEKELESAQLYQRQFLPDAPFVHRDLEVAGNYLPASECAGDWWRYAEVNDQVLVVIADVAGHGAGAALYTAVVQGAFTQWITEARKRKNEAIRLDEFMSGLNSVVVNSARESTFITLLAMVIDLNTGQLTIANAGHPSPYVYRGKDSLIVLAGARMDPLGAAPELKCVPESFQLQAGDRIFAYTDGFTESEKAPVSRMKKPRLLDLLRSEIPGAEQSAQAISNRILKARMEFFGTDGKPGGPDTDDITIVTVAYLDRNAK